MQVISGKVEKAKKVTIYGPEGIGKSSLAGQFPNPIFIDTEGSTTEMNVDRLGKPTSWTMLKQQVEWVKQQAGQFKTLVIDTIDWAEMLCVESVCAQYGKKGVEDFGYGNGYVYTKEEFGRFLNLLSDVIEAGIHVVLVAHAQIVKFEQPDEMGAYDRYQLKLGKKTSSQTAPLVKEWADMVLFINYKTFSVAADEKGRKHKGQGGVRTVYATHHPAWDAKNRHGLPDEFPLDYAHIAHIFNGSGKAQAAPSTQPSQEQRSVEEMQYDLVNGLRNAILDEQKQQAWEQITGGQTMPQEQQPSAEDALTLNISQNIPRSLRDLMVQHQVSENEIQIVVSQKGYYPMDTPITNYDPGFIEGVLVGAWPQVYIMIQEARKNLPF
ncbi:ATP-binding protein [Brevibacillus laterosporus]|uniref:ATP-binding protein n=1 Tax=Brevibacillus laterosporus TaxID=1465 RepID=UPI0018CF69AB|nr:ATP-binding protein [Brevibacillus laterosporus]MBG9799507.1 phage protein [Brevibacillus laterosporus]MED1909775.1 ATP-binding protein [Brevibacillus laterosporus]